MTAVLKEFAARWNPHEPNDPSYAIIKRLDKAETHLHAGGSYPLHYLFQIASEEQQRDLNECVKKIAKGSTYEDVIKMFPTITKITNTDKKIEDGIYAICDFLKKDGVRIAEIRSGLKKLDTDEEGYLKAILNGIEQANSESFKAGILLSVQRDSTPEFVKKAIDLALKYKGEGVVGIDISGLSTKGDIEILFPELKRARDNGLFLTIHMGESWEEKDQMIILKELNPHRIGHGVCLHKEAKEWIKKHTIPVEVCISSAKRCKMHHQNESHPWLKEYLENDHPIILGTDDPTLFGVNLSDEYYSLLSCFKIEQIQRLAEESLKHSFLKL